MTSSRGCLLTGKQPEKVYRYPSILEYSNIDVLRYCYRTSAKDALTRVRTRAAESCIILTYVAV